MNEQSQMPDAKSIVRHVIDQAWNNGDLQMLNTIVAPNYIRRFPGGEVNGPEGFRRRIAGTRAAFPDFHCEIDDVVEENGTGVVRWTATGTHARAEVTDIGWRIQWSGTTWFRVANEQLVEEQEFYDPADLVRKLGAAE